MSTPMDGGWNAKALLDILAQINRRMITMLASLHARPEVQAANRICDVLDYRDFTGAKFSEFEVYIEVETSAGEFCWSLELRANAESWEVYRGISVARETGGDLVTDFAHVSFESFELFVLGVMPLVDEFARSATDFDFSSQRLGKK
jgi:hypothetical protein